MIDLFIDKTNKHLVDEIKRLETQNNLLYVVFLGSFILNCTFILDML